MVDNIMLVCKYGDERLAIESESYPSYEKLIEVIVEKWVNLRYEQVNLSYATPVLDKFLLKDSVDFRAMLRMASIFDMKYMEIDVKAPFAKKDMLLELGSFRNSCPVISNDEPSSSSCVSSETSIVVHSSIDTPLLSAYWGMGLSHVGQTFPGGRIEFRDALAKYAIDGGFSVGFKRNDKQFVIGFCKTRKTANTDCPWFVRASICSSNGYFIIREFVNCHTCEVRLKREESKQLSSKLVARLITKPLVGAKRPWNPSDVMYHMKQSYGQELDYKIAWNALSKAKEQLYGDEVSSYQQLWWYTRAATEMNPGSKIVLELEERTNSFKRIFLAWGACIEGFKDIRPMLFLDGTFLKGKFQGVLLSATGKNANQELYPLAYAIVDGETKGNWEWFMSCLREVVGYDRTITFISDRNEGLLASIQTVFPESPNFFCMRHLQDNIKGRYTGMTMRKLKVKMVNLLTECAKATTLTDFQTCYTEFRHAGGKIVDDFLVDMPLSKWTNLYAGPGRYGEMTSNGAESFNNWIMDARELPITQCIDKLRQKLMEWFVERRTTAAKWNGHVCPIMEKKLKRLNSEGRTWRVKNANHLVFEVSFKQTYSVDLKNRRCSCNVWQLDGFPCSHAVACVNSSRVYLMQDYIDDYWFVDRYRRCYEKTIMPIPSSVKEQYMFVNDPTILPPKTRSRPGRRAKRRIRSKGEREDKKLIQCSRCKKLGSHNKKTCTARI